MKCLLEMMISRAKKSCEKMSIISSQLFFIFCTYFILALAQSALNRAMPLSVSGCFMFGHIDKIISSHVHEDGRTFYLLESDMFIWESHLTRFPS